MLTLSPSNPRLPGAQSQIQRLADEHKTEVLNFLAARPLSTFIERSWIKDNGLDSPFNRGVFYGYRDMAGQLEGVALIGHVTVFETRNDSALAAFAQLAQNCHSTRLVLSERDKISRFMAHYGKCGLPPRHICRELLLEKQASETVESVPALRRANAEDLGLVVPIHAQTAMAESGVNPLQIDPTGFVERCARRIKQGRVWISLEEGRLKFKADVVSDTPEVVYLEGVHVSSEHRGNGYGAKCLTQLTNHLLESTKSVCLMVNETNRAAQKSYTKAGYQFREYYDTVYLKP